MWQLIAIIILKMQNKLNTFMKHESRNFSTDQAAQLRVQFLLHFGNKQALKLSEWSQGNIEIFK